MILVTLPHSCSHINLIQAFEQANILSEDWRQLKIYVPDKCFIYSSAIAFLCTWGLKCRQEGRIITFEGNRKTLSYLARMNLFQHLAIEYNETFTRHNERGRFITLRLIANDHDVFSATNAVCDLVMHQFDNARAFLPAMEWAVNEIIDNIQTHAEATVPAAICAQYYPNNSRLDIGICDMGRGIKASLSEALRLDSHQEAIQQALQRGVTRNTEHGMGNGLAGSWKISQLNEGEFQIWSGNANYLLQDGREEDFTSIPQVAGTGVLFRLKTQHPVNLEDTFIADSALSYIDAESERISEAGGLRIASECRHTGSREVARPCRRKILNLLPDYEGSLVLNFEGISNASSSFMDELLGKLAKQLGQTALSQQIRLINIEPRLLKMANVVIHERLQTGDSLGLDKMSSTLAQKEGSAMRHQNGESMYPDDEVTLHLIASGLMTLVEQVSDGKAPKLPYPRALQRGLDRLVVTCLRQNKAPPQGVPDLLTWCQRPLSEWSLDLPKDAISPTDRLLTKSLPTRICEEWADSAADVEAEVEQRRIMLSVLSTCRNKNAPESYQAFRRLLISQPVMTALEFQMALIQNPSLRPLTEHLKEAYEKAPEACIKDGYFYCCQSCNNLLRRTPDGALICEDESCRNTGITDPSLRSTARFGRKISKEEGVLWVKRGLRRFIVAPGRIELRLEKKLKKHGVEVELWPAFDEYDLRLTFPDGEIWAIDAKDWANPFLLAKQVKPIPHHPPWTRAYFVFPDERRQQRPDYVRAFYNHCDFLEQSGIKAVFESDLLAAVKRRVEGR